MRIYLVRHGEAKAETEAPARPLTDRGRAGVGRGGRGAAGGGGEGEGLGPNDDPEVARDECERAAAPVMLVGHLPHLGRLAGTLVRGRPAPGPVGAGAGAAPCLA